MTINIYHLLVTLLLSVGINYLMITVAMSNQNKTIKILAETMKKISLKDIKSRKILNEGNAKIKKVARVKFAWAWEEIVDLFSVIKAKFLKKDDSV